MQQFTYGNQLDYDHVVEIADDRNVIGQNVFRVGKIDEGCQQPLPVNYPAGAIRRRSACEISDSSSWNAFRRQSRAGDHCWRISLSTSPNRLDDLRFLRIADRMTGLFERITEKAKIAVRQLER